MIKAFLSDRKHRVQLNGIYSSRASVLSGIHQGSIIGPLLFIICINDSPDCLNDDSEVYLYADDVKYFRHMSTSQDSLLLQDDINELSKGTDEYS